MAAIMTTCDVDLALPLIPCKIANRGDKRSILLRTIKPYTPNDTKKTEQPQYK